MFRFTIRDVLWLTALAAVGAGWWANAKRMSAENLVLQEKLEKCEVERSSRPPKP